MGQVTIGDNWIIAFKLNLNGIVERYNLRYTEGCSS